MEDEYRMKKQNDTENLVAWRICIDSTRGVL